MTDLLGIAEAAETAAAFERVLPALQRIKKRDDLMMLAACLSA